MSTRVRAIHHRHAKSIIARDSAASTSRPPRGWKFHASFIAGPRNARAINHRRDFLRRPITGRSHARISSRKARPTRRFLSAIRRSRSRDRSLEVGGPPRRTETTPMSARSANGDSPNGGRGEKGPISRRRGQRQALESAGAASERSSPFLSLPILAMLHVLADKPCRNLAKRAIE
jgi:hypothetical protein